MPVTTEQVERSLGRIGIATHKEQDVVLAEIPGFRPDLDREVDLIEEVIRVEGYDRVGETLPGVRQQGGVPPAHAFRQRIREALVRSGLNEISSYSFASSADLELTGDHDAVRVANPLAADDEFMRTSLIPGLLRAVAQNQARQVTSVALCEVGNVFFPPGGADRSVEEHERVALAFGGQAHFGFPGERREFDFFDAKGAIEVLLGTVGVRRWALGGPPTRRLFHPTRSASLLVEGELAGEVGELHPRVAARLDLAGRVALAELEVGVLAKRAAEAVGYREVPRYPPVRRDLAFVLPERAPAGQVGTAIAEAAGGLCDNVELFDVHHGPPIPNGKRSLAFSVDFRAPDRTLTDEEANRAVEAIAERLSRDFGAELRSG